jgi:hypothetical protein
MGINCECNAFLTLEVITYDFLTDETALKL